jgi:hypothetical protein
MQYNITQTSHTFAIELHTQRVWDYSGDGYVHRLVANRVDGKVICINYVMLHYIILSATCTGSSPTAWTAR